ncbi:integrin alpha-PS5 [Copidosoma floridanum]|uniref:integrin alpha-PS5 n=1 Tax=Copidosoma floridanum TaxID=29053 RepID=UPI0006C98F53|nr:integrin alpha-PS5 [Copidosoma floridanum]
MLPHYCYNNYGFTRCFYCIGTLLLLITATNTFDIFQPGKIFSDPNGNSCPSPTTECSNYFGYSVALYVSQNNKALILVGAPRTDFPHQIYKHEQNLKPGAVYRCQIINGMCHKWDLISTIKNKLRQNSKVFWLGTTVLVENSSKPTITACASLWKTKLEDKPIGTVSGICFSVKETEESFVNYELLNKVDHHFINLRLHNMGEAGISAHIVEANHETHRLLIGTPGAFDSKAPVFTVKGNHSKYSTSSHNLNPFEIPGSMKNHDYFGYSITSGYFYKKNELLYAFGAPRASALKGRVYFYEKNLQVMRLVVEGEQFGEYFGSSLTACDVNGDGRDDLIVGAPQWSRETDEGRVYAYVSKGEKVSWKIFGTFKSQRFEKNSIVSSHDNGPRDPEKKRKEDFEKIFEAETFQTRHVVLKQFNWTIYRIDGNRTKGRFGTSVACLGDIDHDGLNDIAIGAPYERNEKGEGLGAVHIYSGSRDRDLLRQHMQHIPASEVSNTRLLGFGFSLSDPARDTDGDGVPDLAVGSHKSGHVVLLISRPVYMVSVELQHNRSSSIIWDKHFFDYSICAKYNGSNDTFKVVVSVMMYESNRQSQHHRNVLKGNLFHSVLLNLKKGLLGCETRYLYSKDFVDNITNPIVLEAKLTSGLADRNEIQIHPKSKITDIMKIAYALDCGEDNTCSSDLKVSITSSLVDANNSYVMGSESNVNLTIFVENIGDPAYLPEVFIEIEEPITPINRTWSAVWRESHCEDKTPGMICVIDSPLRYNMTIPLELNMSAVQYTDLQSFESQFKEIRVKVSSQSEEINPRDNVQSLKINFKVDANINIVGRFQNNNYSFMESEVIQTHSKNLTLHHIYDVYKLGITPIHKAAIFVSIPVRFQDLEIASINYVRVSIQDHKYSCTSDEESKNYSSDEKHKVDTFVSLDETFSINCANPNVECQRLCCDIDSFLETTSVAELIVTIDFRISEDIAKEKNIIFVSQAYAEITTPSVQMDSENKNRRIVHVSSLISRQNDHYTLPKIFIILPVLLGIVLLLIIILILYKVGFFKRNRVEDLRALKPTEEQKNNGDITSGRTEEVKPTKLRV